MQNIFYEPQQGGLCRMHALNAYYGRSKITPAMFGEYQKEYDAFMRAKFNTDVSVADYDYINSDHNTIISYVLKYKDNIYTRFYPAGTNRPDLSEHNFLFLLSDSHVWCMRRVAGVWYRIDSLSGVSPDSISAAQDPKIAVIAPVDPGNELLINLNKLRRIVPPEEESIKRYLAALHKESKILGDIEVPLSIIMEILEMGSRPDRPKITELVSRYNNFLKQFTRGRYLDLELIQANIPYILCKFFRMAKQL